jgi:hypothetical protein
MQIAIPFCPLTLQPDSAILILVNGIAVRCAVDRQKHDQPWTVFMELADGVRKPVVPLLPNCLWAFPGGKGERTISVCLSR